MTSDKCVLSMWVYIVIVSGDCLRLLAAIGYSAPSDQHVTFDPMDMTENNIITVIIGCCLKHMFMIYKWSFCF